MVEVVALLEQRERDAPGAPSGRGERRFGELGFGPLRVRGLRVGGQPPDVPAVDGREVPADGDGRASAGRRTRGRTARVV